MSKTTKKGSSKGFTKGKGKSKNRNEGKGFKDCKNEGQILIEAENDISWYMKNPQMFVDAANIPYGYPVGANFRPVVLKRAKDSASITRSAVDYYLPGIDVFRWIPTPGLSTDSASPVNIAAANIYSYIRQANSGARNYDSPDLMIYLLAMDSCYAYHAYMMRLYGVLRNTVPTVKYMPDKLTYALGGDFVDLQANMANFRYYINNFAARLQAMAVPANLYYNTRHRWMSSNVYMDESTAKPQLFAFVPHGFYQFKLDSTNAGMLELVPLFGQYEETLTPKYLTLKDLIDYGEAMLAPIVGSEDFNIISGDILKAYDQVLSVPTCTEDYMVDPVYSEEVLLQVHNLTTMGIESLLMPDSEFTIKQDASKSCLLFNPRFTLGGSPWSVTDFTFVDCHRDIPTPADTFVSTRLQATWDLTGLSTTAGNITLNSCGSELVFAWLRYEFDPNPLGQSKTGKNKEITRHNLYTFRDFTETTFHMNNFINVSMNGGFAYGSGSFNYAPLQTTFFTMPYSDEEPTTVSWMNVVGQKNNLTKINKTILSNMHYTALLSLFNVPALGIAK